MAHTIGLRKRLSSVTATATPAVTRLVLCTICIICPRHRRVQAVLCVCVMSGSAISRTMCIYVYDYMYAIFMRQRGTFTHYMHATARALSLSRQRGNTWACRRRRVCRTARAFELVGVCSSLLEFALSPAVSLGRSVFLRSCGPAGVF